MDLPPSPSGSPSFDYSQYQPLSEPPKVVRAQLATGATVCGVAVVLGSILPWGTLELAGVGSMTLDGLDRDGSLTLVLGLAAIGVLIVSIAIGAVWPVVVGGGLFLITSIVSVINISDIRTLGGFDLTNSVEVGIGLWLVLAASVTGMILCGVGFVRRQV